MQAFDKVDVIMGPTTPHPAWKLGDKSSDPVAMYLEDIYTVTANLAGIPGLSLPCGFAHGLPVGLQLLGGALEEATLLRIADAFQGRTDHHEKRPPEAP